MSNARHQLKRWCMMMQLWADAVAVGGIRQDQAAMVAQDEWDQTKEAESESETSVQRLNDNNESCLEKAKQLRMFLENSQNVGTTEALDEESLDLARKLEKHFERRFLLAKSQATLTSLFDLKTD